MVGTVRSVGLTLKPDEAAFTDALRRHRRFELFHWTLIDQLPTILQHGLLCRRELDGRGVSYEPHGYGRAGKEEEFAGYLCFSFLPHWGMMANASGPVAVIELTSRLVALEGAFFCPGNSARNDYDFDDLSRCTSVDDFDGLFTGLTDWDLVDRQAEVWVPSVVPVATFNSIYFRTNDDLEAALAICQPIADAMPETIYFQVKASKFPPALEPSADGAGVEDIVF